MPEQLCSYGVGPGVTAVLLWPPVVEACIAVKGQGCPSLGSMYWCDVFIYFCICAVYF